MLGQWACMAARLPLTHFVLYRCLSYTRNPRQLGSEMQSIVCSNVQDG
jgi:hypothetical protein